jgi:hypothetical protein
MQNFCGRIGARQSVAYTGTAGQVTNGVGIGVNKVRVLVTTDALVSTDGVNSTYLVGMQAEYFTVTQGQKVSATQVTAGGTLHVNEMT